MDPESLKLKSAHRGATNGSNGRLLLGKELIVCDSNCSSESNNIRPLVDSCMKNQQGLRYIASADI